MKQQEKQHKEAGKSEKTFIELLKAEGKKFVIKKILEAIYRLLTVLTQKKVLDWTIFILVTLAEIATFYIGCSETNYLV